MIRILLLAALGACGYLPERQPAPQAPAPPSSPPPTLPPDCRNGYTTSYQQVAQITRQKCLSCHPGFNSYQALSTRGDEIIRRVNLGTNDPRRMPPPPSNELEPQERNLFNQWREDGYPQQRRCKDSIGSSFTLDATYIRGNIIADLQGEREDIRNQARFLIASHKFNEVLGSYPKSLVETGLNKGVNSISFSADIRKLGAIDDNSTIYRIDLGSFGRTKADWELIVQNDPFRIIDNSTEGQLIRQLTGSAQPWLHADNFLNVALSPDVYNKLMRIPLRADDLYRQLGVDRQAQHDAKSVRYLAFTDSPISNTNRRIRRYDTFVNGQQGFLWVSNDTDDNDLPNIPQSNVFGFPLSDEAGGWRIFEYRAEEWIFTLPNRMIAFALYDFPDQLRQVAAPVTIVRQNGPFDAEISNGRDCFRCHNKIIEKQDRLLAAAQQSGDFDADDFERIEDFYQPNSVNQTLFTRDNNLFGSALGQLGISVQGADPVNGLTDQHRSNYDLNKVAAFFFLKPEEFQRRLFRSRRVRGQIPQLLSGGNIELSQLILATPDIIDEFGLFEDDD